MVDAFSTVIALGTVLTPGCSFLFWGAFLMGWDVEFLADRRDVWGNFYLVRKRGIGALLEKGGERICVNFS